MDPSLVKLTDLEVPKLRTITFIDANSSCEAWLLAEPPIEVEPSEGFCGDELGKIPEGGLDAYEAEHGETTISEGDECPWTRCSETVEACVSSTATESGYDCVRCSEVNDAEGIEPSESVCAGLVSQTLSLSIPDEDKIYCEYYDSAWHEAYSIDGCAEIVFPENEFSTSLDCSQLREYAKDNDSESCRAYDLLYSFVSGQGDDNIDDVGDSGVFPLLEEVCHSDPCGLAPPKSSCKVFTADKSDLTDSLLGEMLSAGGIFGDVIANCADAKASAYGYDDCTSVYGDQADCNPTW